MVLANLSVLSLALSLIFPHVFEAVFLVSFQCLSQLFWISSVFLAMPFFSSPTTLTISLTNFRNLAFSLYVLAKKSVIGLPNTRILVTVTTKFLMNFPASLKNFPIFLKPFFTDLTIPSQNFLNLLLCL